MGGRHAATTHLGGAQRDFFDGKFFFDGRSEIGPSVFLFWWVCWRLFENSLRWSPCTHLKCGHLTASVNGLSVFDRRFLDVLCANSRNCGLAVKLRGETR